MIVANIKTIVMVVNIETIVIVVNIKTIVIVVNIKTIVIVVNIKTIAIVVNIKTIVIGLFINIQKIVMVHVMDILIKEVNLVLCYSYRHWKQEYHYFMGWHRR